MSRLDELKAQRAQLDALIASGTLTGDAARQARDALEAEILGQVLQPAAPAAGTRLPVRLLAGVGIFVLAFGVAGYAWLGNPAAIAVAPGAPAAAVPSGAGHEGGQAQFEAMAAKLAKRLETQPDDAEGWSMLGRSYTVLERYPEALAAYQALLKLKPNDAQALADAADAMGMAQGRKLAGEPEALINRALASDPDNPKALGLAGTIAFDRGDPATAARHWARALGKLDPASEMAARLQGAVDEARKAAGLPALPPVARAPAVDAAPAGMPAAPVATAEAAAPGPASADTARTSATAAVQLRVTLAPALAAAAAPDDTLFVFARAAQGSRMPLAIQRKQVKDLPLDITLDDSMAMSPATRLSTATQVVLGARISKSGNAMPQPGDLQGLSAPVAVGTRGVQLQIGERLP